MLHGARICPRCSTRVDERRAKTSPFCLSCGAPLAGPSPTFAGKAPGAGGRSALPWVLGGLAVFVLFVIGGVVALVVAASDDEPVKPAPVAATSPPPPPIETSAAAVSGAPQAPPNAKPPATRVTSPVGTPSPTQTSASPLPTPTPPPLRVDAGPAPLGPFPRARAQAEVDRVGSTLSTCNNSTGPFGGSSIRIDFEPDGRVGTLTRPPFAGTAVGSCISARFRAIKIGPFQGTTQSIERGFIIQN